MSFFENVDNGDWDDEETALVSVDTDQAIYVTRGAVGTGTWFREPCNCENEDCAVGLVVHFRLSLC